MCTAFIHDGHGEEVSGSYNYRKCICILQLHGIRIEQYLFTVH